MISKEMLAEMPAHGDVWCMDVSRVSRFVAIGDRKVSPRIPKVTGNIAVIPLHGVITKRSSWFSDGTEAVLRAVEAAMASKAIGGVVLDIDSPGGSTYGLMEFADALFALRGMKPLIAVANPLAASAALWSGTSAEQFVVTPSGDAGSVGVWTMHVDQSKMLDEYGYNVTLISAGKYKVEGNSYEPLSDEAKAEFQRSVDESYSQFISTLARNRGVTRSKVESDFGQGRILSSERAVAAGMADRVASLDDVLAKMGATKGASRGSASVEAERDLIAAWNGNDIVSESEPHSIESRLLSRKLRERSKETTST